MNIVDDDEMSSQGSVNAPMAAPGTAAQVQEPTRQRLETPSGLPPWPHSPMAQEMQQPTPTAQSSVFAGRSGVAPTVPVATGSVQPSVDATTVPVDAPSRQDTKEAFQEVSSAFQEMSTKHGQIQGSLQVLASTVEALKQAQQGMWHHQYRCKRHSTGLHLWRAISKPNWVQHLSLKSNPE